MMSIGDRKIKNSFEKEKLEQLISDASTLGVKFVELRFNQRREIGPRYQGVMEIKIEERSRNRGTEFGFYTEWLNDGQVIFHPDRRQVCWAYLPIKSMRNRKDKNLLFLAETLRRGDFTIVDEEVHQLVKDIAVENNWPSNPEKHSKLDYYLQKKKKENLEVVKTELESENELLKAKLALLEERERIAEIEQEAAKDIPVGPKPKVKRSGKALSGKTADRAKVAKAKEEEKVTE